MSSLVFHAGYALACLACTAVLGFAQRNVVQDAGGGRKTETDYDASDKVTRQLTLGPDGNILVRTEYEYLSGYPASQATVVQQITTTYGPNGQISEVTRQRFDENTNFTEELIRVFDASGKQIGGHTLTHNPWNGTYACADWNVAEKAYRQIECPSGEESSEGPETTKKFTRQEVMQALELARAAAQQQEKTLSNMRAGAVANKSAGNEIGIVLPAYVRQGERISGIVTAQPNTYDGMPEVRVTRVALPLKVAEETPKLADWTFETTGEASQFADGPITLTVPHDASELKVTFRAKDNLAPPIDAGIRFSKASRATPNPGSFKTEALCLKGQLCIVRGPFSGDSRKTFAAFENRPAKIVGETQETALIAVPESVTPGARPLFISEGNRMMALPVVVGEFAITNNGQQLPAGRNLTVFPTLDGPAEIPDELWRANGFPSENYRQGQELLHELKVPLRDNKEDDTKEEPRRKKTSSEEEKAGRILVVVKNDSPQQLTLRGSKNQMLVFRLNDESFRMGVFKFTLVVEGLKSGPVQVKGYVIPLLASIAAQEFNAPASH